ncbi:hypothetical protein [Nakamurella lactea]|uniref:hypothetical protein n=1 Tax=Nakamurella lactea TaxID=459515 RepID=UPI000404DDA2|nr:hypothetical protein [Nakamurella lactea]
MVNNTSPRPSATRAPGRLTVVTMLVAGYLVLTVATLAALAILSVTAPEQATSEAWGHAVIVALFAALLLIRLRAARRGSSRALTAVGLIAGILVVANLVEAALPHSFPGWMRVQMVVVAVLMAGTGFAVRRIRHTR